MIQKSVVALTLLLSSPALAWEVSTNAGLTEAAALSTGLHQRLIALGAKDGFYTPLRIDPKKYPQLFERLALVDPSEGYAPDRSGRLSALGWLVAGAVLEEVPGDRGRHHFYEPGTGRGLSGRGWGSLKKLTAMLSAGVSGFVSTGKPATEWIVAADNDLGMARFDKELALARAAQDPAERDEHLALALVCAGAMTAVLEDLGSPSRTRDDLYAHLLDLGGGPGDRGSRFERLAALLYGREGVATAAPVTKPTWKDYFVELATITHDRYYSQGTLPGEVVVADKPAFATLLARVVATQRYPKPAPKRFDLAAAGSDDGAQLLDDAGVCLANYKIEEKHLYWYMTDDCATTQVHATLSTIVPYAAGFLESLFPAQAAPAAPAPAAPAPPPAAPATQPTPR